jgi:hypothetical protein
MNPIELFKFRHIFAGDDHIGKYNSQTHTVTLRDEFAHKADDVKAYFMRHHGICLATVVVGTEQLETVKPVKAFPPEIDALKSAQFGDLTPEVVAWARQNWSKEDFDRRYRGCPEYGDGPGAEPDPAPVKKSRKSNPQSTDA